MSALIVSGQKNDFSSMHIWLHLDYHFYTFTRHFSHFLQNCLSLFNYVVSFVDDSLFPEHTQDKHIQRDDEYYEGDNDNDHHMDDV